MTAAKNVKTLAVLLGVFCYSEGYAFDFWQWFGLVSGERVVIEPNPIERDDGVSDPPPVDRDNPPDDDRDPPDDDRDPPNDDRDPPDDDPGDDKDQPVNITEFLYNGSGCPERLDAEISEDGDRITVWFDEIYAETGAGLGLPEGRHNCQFIFTLDYDPSTTFAVDAISGEGYAMLGGDSTGTFKSITYFQGESEQSEYRKDISGDYDDYYQFYDQYSDLIFAPCDKSRALNINNQVRISRSELYNLITVEGKLEFDLVWQPCR